MSITGKIYESKINPKIKIFSYLQFNIDWPFYIKTFKSVSCGSNSRRSLRSWLERLNKVISDSSCEPGLMRRTSQPALHISPSICALTAAQCPPSAGPRQSPPQRTSASLACKVTDRRVLPSRRTPWEQEDGWMEGNWKLVYWSDVRVCRSRDGATTRTEAQILDGCCRKGRRATGEEEGRQERENLLFGSEIRFDFRCPQTKVCISWLYLQPDQLRETLNYSHFPPSE